jgi:hypothetical protein
MGRSQEIVLKNKFDYDSHFGRHLRGTCHMQKCNVSNVLSFHSRGQFPSPCQSIFVS